MVIRYGYRFAMASLLVIFVYMLIISKDNSKNCTFDIILRKNFIKVMF